MSLQTLMRVRTDRHGVCDRRTFLRGTAFAAGAAALGFKAALTLHADELPRQGKACVLLFMSGAPSQFETFAPKPGQATGGPTQAIATSAPGIQIAEHWPKMAAAMKDVALIRSVHNKEGAHPRAVYQLHTGYAPS